MALRETLAELIPETKDIRLLLIEADIPLENVVLTGSAQSNWQSALATAEMLGKWPKLITRVLWRYPDHTVLWRALGERAGIEMPPHEDADTVQENGADEMAPDTQRNGSGYVTLREFFETQKRIDDDMEEMRRDLEKQIEETRHKLREEYAPTVSKFSAMEKVVTRQLVGQGIVIGMTIVAIVALIFVATGGRIVIGQ